MRGVAVCRRLSPSAGASVLTIPRFLSASRRLGSADAHCTTPATHDNLSFEAQSRGSHTRCLRFAAFLPALSRSYGHARLASGWWPAFTGRGSRPRKVPNEVSASSTWLPPHPSFTTQSTAELGCRTVWHCDFAVFVRTLTQLRTRDTPLQFHVVLNETCWIIVVLARYFAPNSSNGLKGGVSLRHWCLPAVRAA